MSTINQLQYHLHYNNLLISPGGTSPHTLFKSFLSPFLLFFICFNSFRSICSGYTSHSMRLISKATQRHKLQKIYEIPTYQYHINITKYQRMSYKRKMFKLNIICIRYVQKYTHHNMNTHLHALQRDFF